MSFIFRWKPSVIPLLRMNRYMWMISSDQDSSVFRNVVIASKGQAFNDSGIESLSGIRWITDSFRNVLSFDFSGQLKLRCYIQPHCWPKEP